MQRGGLPPDWRHGASCPGDRVGIVLPNVLSFPTLFYGALIGDGSNPTGLFIGYVVGGAIMVLGGIVELAIGIKAEGKSLEAITKPITSTAEPAPVAT